MSESFFYSSQHKASDLYNPLSSPQSYGLGLHLPSDSDSFPPSDDSLFNTQPSYTSSSRSTSRRPAGIETLPIEDILRNPIARRLFDDYQEASKQVVKSTKFVQQMVEENQRLSRENQALRSQATQSPRFRAISSQFSRSGSLAPSDSISQSPSSASSVISDPIFSTTIRSASRPPNLPHEILWHLADCADDPDVMAASSSDHNKSRPPMRAALREKDGSMLTKEKYATIKADVVTLCNASLHHLEDPQATRKGAKPPTRSMSWYKTNHRVHWNKVVASLERMHDVLLLCASSWKAEQMINRHLSSSNSTSKKCSTKAVDLEGGSTAQALPNDLPILLGLDDIRLPATTRIPPPVDNPTPIPLPIDEPVPMRPLVDEPAPTPPPVDERALTPPPVDQPAPMQPLVDKPASTPPPVNQPAPANKPLSTMSKRPRSDSYTLNDTTNTPSKKIRGQDEPQVLENHAPDEMDIFGLQKPPSNTTQASSNVSPLPGLNISNITVSPLYGKLKESIEEFPGSISTLGSALMDRLQHLTTTPNLYQPQEPDENVTAFIMRIESANPNCPTLSEDDTDAGWGHYQFTAAAMNVSSVLTSWKAVGNVNTAFRLLAATVRTCRVARYICYCHKVEPASYLSDMYLDRVVETLWGLVKDFDIMPSPNTEANGSQGVGGATDSIEKSLQLLTIPVLKGWMQKHHIVSATRTPKKEDLVAAILASQHIPSAAEISKMLPERRNNKGKKATLLAST